MCFSNPRMPFAFDVDTHRGRRMIRIGGEDREFFILILLIRQIEKLSNSTTVYSTLYM